MLIIFITVLLLLVINFGVGIIVGKILHVKNQSFTQISFLGMMGIAFSQTIIAFFFPLNIYVESVFSIFGLIGILLFLKKKDFSCLYFRGNVNFWFYFFLATILFIGAFSPYLFDHYSYYVPTISYLKEVGFVKGISNLDILLGQSSFWHIYQAGFSNVIDVDLRVNTYLLILFLIYIYERKQSVLLIFIPFFLLFTQQPSPDLPVFVITLIIINELINTGNSKLLLILSLFAFCIKPIVFWLPILIISESVCKKTFKIQMLISILAFGLLFIIKNIWLFGFPVFPVSAIGLDLPWKPRQEILTFSSQIGLMKSYDMHYSYQQVLDFNIWERIYHWFTIGYRSFFNFCVIISLLILGIFAFTKKQRFYTLLFICVLVKFVLIIIFSAQYRFFIDVFLVASFLIFKDVSEGRSLFVSVFFSILIGLMFTFPGLIRDRFQSGKWLSGFAWSQIISPSEYRSEGFKSYHLGNLKFNSKKWLTYKTPFPTIALYQLRIYQYYGIFPQVSDGGFIQKKLSDEEETQLDDIIKDLEKSKP